MPILVIRLCRIGKELLLARPLGWLGLEMVCANPIEVGRVGRGLTFLDGIPEG